ncbi:DUF885 domain-containing protein [Actinoplanes sp. NPDC000266]
MSAIDDLAEKYVDDWARLNPIGATFVGLGGPGETLDDLSPDGYAARADLLRRTLAGIDAIVPATEAERVSADAMKERLGLDLARYDEGDTTSDVNVISSAAHAIRRVFDVMPMEGEPALAAVAARLAAVPGALRQYEETLLAEAVKGNAAARAQMLAVAEQAGAWTDPARDDFYPALAERAGATGALGADLKRNADQAAAATAEFGQFLRTRLAPYGREKEAVGAQRHARAAQYFLGAVIDQRETYAWGFEELARIEAEMRVVAAEIAGPGASVEEAVAVLEADPARRLHSKEEFRDWMQATADKTIAELNGTHVDIPPAVRAIEAHIAPTSDGAIYYTPPNHDFSRPGRMWWAVPDGQTSFSTWQQTSMVYHEGVPGHHLQLGQKIFRSGRLNRWQRLLSFCSGHAEGWALYAERLMGELGYLDDPGARLGMLDLQALRAARVVLDIGLHLELEIPAGNPFGFHPGERWTPELGWEFLSGHSRMHEQVLRFELRRYLGWPGQALSYKVGERIWLQARQDAQARQGAGFDLKAFHRDALDLGTLGLDPLRRALGRL